MAYEVEIDGQRFMVDESGLENYVNPQTGELSLDVVAGAIKDELAQQEPENMPQGNMGMDSETRESFDQSNEILKNIDYWANRGNNFGGGFRNFAMGAIPGTAEIEAAMRATKQKIQDFDPTVKADSGKSWGENYDTFLQNARESREEYMKKNPTKALALQIGGGLATSLAPFGLATKLGTASKLGALGRSALGRNVVAGGLTGGAFGFGNSQGGLENRLEDALRGTLFGAGAGAVGTGVAYGLGGLRNTTQRLSRGWGSDVPQAQTEKFILSDTLQPTIESRSKAATLGLGSSAGAKDIERAGYELRNMKEAMDGMIKPGAYTGKTSGGTTAQDLLKATQHPSMTAAKKNFGDFVESLPTVENPTRTVDSVLYKNDTARKILGENSDAFVISQPNDSVSVLEPSEFSYWQKAQQILQNKLPKKYTPSKLTGTKKDVYDAIEEIKSTREKLFPGTKKTNAEYASAIQDQRVLDKEVKERLGVISSQEKPQSVPGGAIPTLHYFFGPARQRGLSRELIERGAIREPATTRGLQLGGEAGSSLMRSLLNLK